MNTEERERMRKNWDQLQDVSKERVVRGCFVVVTFCMHFKKTTSQYLKSKMKLEILP